MSTITKIKNKIKKDFNSFSINSSSRSINCRFFLFSSTKRSLLSIRLLEDGRIVVIFPTEFNIEDVFFTEEEGVENAISFKFREELDSYFTSVQNNYNKITGEGDFKEVENFDAYLLAREIKPMKREEFKDYVLSMGDHTLEYEVANLIFQNIKSDLRLLVFFVTYSKFKLNKEVKNMILLFLSEKTNLSNYYSAIKKYNKNELNNIVSNAFLTVSNGSNKTYGNIEEIKTIFITGAPDNFNKILPNIKKIDTLVFYSSDVYVTMGKYVRSKLGEDLQKFIKDFPKNIEIKNIEFTSTITKDLLKAAKERFPDLDITTKEVINCEQ